MGSWNLYSGSFKQKNKHSAEGEAHGRQLAGFLLSGGSLLAGQLHTSYGGLCEGRWQQSLMSYVWDRRAEFFSSTNKGLQTSRKVSLIFFCVSLPSHGPLLPMPPLLLLFSLLSARSKPLWNRLFLDASSKFHISSFLPLFKAQAEEGTHGLPQNSTLPHSLKPYRIYSLPDKPPFASLCLMCWITSLFGGPVFFHWLGAWDWHLPGLSNRLALGLHQHSPPQESKSNTTLW